MLVHGTSACPSAGSVTASASSAPAMSPALISPSLPRPAWDNLGASSRTLGAVSTPAEVKARLDAEREGKPFLVFRDDADAQHIHALRGTTTIGRRPERDVALTWDTEVSRLHAQLEPVGPDWIVADDGLSRNGTYVNGERVNGRRRLQRRRPARVRRDAGDVPRAEGRVGLDGRGHDRRAHGRRLPRRSARSSSRCAGR